MLACLAATTSPETGRGARSSAPRRRLATLAGLVCWGLLSLAPVSAITIQFDYSHDAGIGFFGTAQNPTPARTTLEFAAKTFTSFTDTLAAIQPGGGNGWEALYLDPLTNQYRSAPNLAVPQNTLIIYAMPLDLPDQVLGQARPGTHAFLNTPAAAFSNAVTNRNQGNAAVDFAPWGGVIAVDLKDPTGAARNWHYDLNAQPAADAYDFYTAVTHELAHILGFGTSTAFTADITNNAFTGVHTQSLYNGAVPMSGGQHWASTVTSPPYMLGTQPAPSLIAQLLPGERRLFTPLDYAALADIGWQVPAKLFKLPGDFNDDHVVDGSDFLLWQRNFGMSGILPADANSDGLVNSYDFWILRNNMGSVGAQYPHANAAGAAVPEPTGGALAVLSLATLYAAKRRRAAHSIMNDVTVSSCSQASAK